MARTNRQGIFALIDVRERQVSGNWLLGDVLGNTKHGYFGSGSSGGPALSTVERIDYTNDTATASARGSLSAGRSYAAATGNSDFGYFGGGFPVASTVIERVDYSNDTASTSVRGPLSANRYSLAAVSNNSYGYFGGGRTPSPNSWVTTVNRIEYANDTPTTTPKGPLSLARYGLAATGNASFGYFGGGFDSNHKSTIDRIDYSNDTATAAPKGPLYAGLGKSGLGATGNASFGYFGGGAGPTASTIERLDYASDTSLGVNKGPLSTVRRSLSATGNASFGYFGGGYNPAAPQFRSTVDRVDYSNDTPTASPKGPLSTNRVGLVAASAGANGLTQKTYTINSPAQVKPFMGYFGGGQTATISVNSSVDRIDYVNDTATTIVKGPLSAGRYKLAATGNTSFGYFGGGYAPGGGGLPRSTVDRIDYANDTPTAVAKGSLSVGRFDLTATGNTSYGYFGGGYASGQKSTIDRIDYSNDTPTATPKGPLSITRSQLAATGNSNYGWFAGGGNPSESSRVDRIDFANDTPTASPRGPLSTGRRQSAATSNGSFGYVGGGHAPSESSTVDRIDFANDTDVAIPRGPLSVARIWLGATGNNVFGYFAGGQQSSVSTIDRITYTNDTVVASPRGPLSVVRYQIAGASPTINGFPQ